jgi:NAD(P)-dependent dehydrogenase (short-subunit alcohol dehydrogenase family)/acyl carrier protein
LEEELGIDSVKLGEVFSVLRERYSLPEKPDIPRAKLKTIAGIADALSGLVQSEELHAAPAPEAAQLNGKGNGHTTWPAGQDHASGMDLLASVRDVFAEVTRYPLEILEPDAQLEEELGIDSVKLGEVFSVLRERYSLPEKPDIPRAKLKTIAGIADALSGLVQAPKPGPAPLFRAESSPLNGKGNGHTTWPVSQDHAPPADLQASVRDVFAQVTRYPMEILEPDAQLEEELGIDSVKLGEVFSVLREKYALPEKLDIPREELKSIAGVTKALSRFLSQPQVAPQPAAEQIARPPSQVRPVPSPASGLAAASFAGLIPELKPFAGKIALVTGSGRGLGKDIAGYLAGLGAAVVVNSFHSREQGIATVKEITAAGGTAIHAWGSVANPDHLAAIFDQIESEYGGLDFFVSNASNGMLARLEDITAEHWQKAFHTNVIGLHQSALRAARLMKKRGGGKIITMSSPASHGYVDYFGCMGAVKAAVESLTKSMAIEFSTDNIQVNCVSPGPIYGSLLDRWPESERLIARWEEATVYERLCEARDVSHFVAYLLSDSVKLFAGSVLVMDGGISVRWG